MAVMPIVLKRLKFIAPVKPRRYMKVETMLEEVDEKEKKGKTIETYSPIPIGFYDNWIGGGGRGP